MNNIKALLALGAMMTAVSTPAFAGDAWVIATQDDWLAATARKSGLEVNGGMATPSGRVATFASRVRRFDQKRRAASIVLEQSPIWQNWTPVENLGPANLADAPVFLAIGPDNYWAFGRYGSKRNKAFTPEPATLEGFDVKLQTTPWPHQFDAPGGLQKGLGGYHAWQSRDMVNWVHHGPVTEGFSRWVTSAEHKDGKVYIYYDYPNDQDPHVYVDDDLTDGKPGKNMGMAVKDPSHGSDAGFIRDKQGRFHVIFEDWSPINASKRSWDSPLAGHAVSDDGIKDWKFLEPAVDKRTKDTGRIAEYRHPHWKQHPDWDTNIGKYHVHEPGASGLRRLGGDLCRHTVLLVRRLRPCGRPSHERGLVHQLQHRQSRSPGATRSATGIPIRTSALPRDDSICSRSRRRITSAPDRGSSESRCGWASTRRATASSTSGPIGRK